MEMYSPIHKHLLLLCEENSDIPCYICSESVSNPYYVCMECQFYIHKSCAESPQQIRHPFHPHPLLLQIQAHNYYCDSCHKPYDACPSYTCYECDFYLDLRCALMKTTEFEGDQNYIEHFSHQHPLKPHMNDENTSPQCLSCKTDSSSPFYYCSLCAYFIHQSCAELPEEINHPFHPPHYLKLQIQERDFYCDSCHKPFDAGLSYTCNPCGFNLDLKCARILQNIEFKGEDFIQHFTHQHPLEPYTNDGNTSPQCRSCKTHSSSPFYYCAPCSYYIHKSCAELPKYIVHALHPSHTLELIFKSGKCTLCGRFSHTLKYISKVQCLDSVCAMKPIPKEEGKKHKDLCILCNTHHLNNENSLCIPSEYYFSDSCIVLPEEIVDHHFHAHKPLTLAFGKPFWCESCHRHFNGNPSYSCDDHDFHMDVRCALMFPVHCDKEQEYIEHFSHQHPLALLSKPEVSVGCSGCKKSLSSPTFACVQCDYFLHQSCAKLPEKIRHPLHKDPDHSFTLRFHHSVYTCNCCHMSYQAFVFQCDSCYFKIGIECLSLVPTTLIDYKYHKHQLHFMEGVNYDSKRVCNSLLTSCKFFVSSKEIKLTEPYFLSCAVCDFSVHLICGPLPCTISPKCHIHALTLKDSVVEADTDEFYCDVCEEERDPRICVYYCEDCEFVSHIHCVITEVINALRKDSNEKRIVGDWRIREELTDNESTDSDISEDDELLESKKTLTLKDILDSISTDEKNLIEDSFYEKLLEESNGEEKHNNVPIFETEQEEDQAENNILSISPYSDELFKVHERNNNSYIRTRRCLIEPDECQLEVVRVMKRYRVPSYLAPVLETLIVKYGDPGISSDLGRNGNSVVFYLLCWALHDMSRTCLDDITQVQLYKWINCVAGAERAGFKLANVAKEYLSSVVKAHIGLQAINQEVEIPLKLEEEIGKLEKEILQLTAKLEMAKESRARFMLNLEGPKSNDMQDCLTKVRAHKWKTLRDFL